MKIYNKLLLLNFIWILGCQSVIPVKTYLDSSYKTAPREVPASPLLFQYKFITPVDEHEILIIDDMKKQYNIRVKAAQASEGYVVNLPSGREYAVASFYLFTGNTKKELLLGKSLPLFKLSDEKLTRIRGFDIINDKDPAVDSISIAPWDGMTDNLLIIQAAKKFQVPEKSIRTINIFKEDYN